MGNRLYYAKVFFIQHKFHIVLGLILFVLGFMSASMVFRHKPPVTEKEYIASLKDGIELFNDKKYVEAYEYLIYPAQQGYSKARYLLGEMFYHGWGVEKDMKLAFENFKSSSESITEAKYMATQMVFRGEAKASDKGTATKNLMEAAYKGFAPAQTDLGIYSFLSEDYEQAYFWLSLAAQAGNKKAKRALEKAFEKVSDYQRALLDAEVRGFIPRK